MARCPRECSAQRGHDRRVEDIAVANLKLDQAAKTANDTLTAKLADKLVGSADDRQLTKTINRYGHVDLLCIDLCRHRDYAESLRCRFLLA